MFTKYFKENSYQCWVAEACEPFFFAQDPQKFSYAIYTDYEIRDKGIEVGSQHRKVFFFITNQLFI